MEGILIYNDTISRPDIVLSNGSLLGGLHCGECLELWLNGHWETAWLELGNDWFVLINGSPQEIPYGQSVCFYPVR